MTEQEAAMWEEAVKNREQAATRLLTSIDEFQRAVEAQNTTMISRLHSKSHVVTASIKLPI